MYSTQLSDYKTYDVDNLILQPNERGDSGVRRVRIMTHNLDGTKGDLIFCTPRLLSFGVQKIYNGQEMIGYQMPLVLWEKNHSTADEKLFASVLEKITDVSKQYIYNSREELGHPDWQEDDLRHLTLLYYKRNTTDHAPLLYVRLNTFRDDKEQVQVRTVFIDDITKQIIDPMLLLNKRCLIYAAIRLESIVVGSKARFQLKLMEARVRFLDRGFKSLLEPGKVFKPFCIAESANARK